MDDFIGRLPSAVVDIPIGSFDPFFNVNTPADLAMAEALAPEVT